MYAIIFGVNASFNIDRYTDTVICSLEGEECEVCEECISIPRD